MNAMKGPATTTPHSTSLMIVALFCAAVLTFCTGCPITNRSFDTAMYQLQSPDGSVRPYWYADYHRYYAPLPGAGHIWSIVTPVDVKNDRKPPLSPESALRRAGASDVNYALGSGHTLTTAIEEYTSANPETAGCNWYLLSVDPILIGATTTESEVARSYREHGYWTFHAGQDTGSWRERIGFASRLRQSAQLNLVTIDESITVDRVYRLEEVDLYDVNLVEIDHPHRTLPGLERPSPSR